MGLNWQLVDCAPKNAGPATFAIVEDRHIGMPSTARQTPTGSALPSVAGTPKLIRSTSPFLAYLASGTSTRHGCYQSPLIGRR
jgi:hypothetical protein